MNIIPKEQTHYVTSLETHAELSDKLYAFTRYSHYREDVTEQAQFFLRMVEVHGPTDMRFPDWTHFYITKFSLYLELELEAAGEMVLRNKTNTFSIYAHPDFTESIRRLTEELTDDEFNAARLKEFQVIVNENFFWIRELE